MADDFQTGICSGSWWNSARSSGGYETAGMSEAAPCSASISADEPVGSASCSTISFQDSHKPDHAPEQMVTGSLMDSTMQIPTFGFSRSTMDWTQALLSSGRAETSFHAMLQDDLSSRPYFRQEASIDSHHANHDSSMNLFKDMNQPPFPIDQHQQLAFSNEHGGDSSINNNFSYGCSTSVLQLQGLLEPDTKPQLSFYDSQLGNYPSQMIGYRGSSDDLQQSPWPKFPLFIKASPPKQQPANQLHFSNNTPFWNANSAGMSDFRSGFQSSIAPQFAKQTSEQKPNCSNLSIKLNSEGTRDSSSSTTRKSSSGETAFKKPRIETPSPLPTFKVRKEKLGDRVTALQQLVSPFGKTDTASVLHEAIEYIKFLHEQVSVLSTPYMKNGHPMQQQQLNMEKSSKDGEEPKQDLKSRGLCLVPVASTYPVASETPPDFWTPTFGGTYR